MIIYSGKDLEFRSIGVVDVRYIWEVGRSDSTEVRPLWEGFQNFPGRKSHGCNDKVDFLPLFGSPVYISSIYIYTSTFKGVPNGS